MNQTNVDSSAGVVQGFQLRQRPPNKGEDMSYGSRVRRDIERWVEAGWIEPQHKDPILSDLASRSHAWSASGALSILGAILLAMSAISFVAANWDAMPKLLAFACLIAAIWAAFLSAGRALDKGASVAGQSLALLGALLFGAVIALTAQTFNMESFRNTAILIWSIGALAVAWAIPSRPALILATILGAWWVYAEIINPAAPDIMWSYLAVWALMMFTASRLESKVAANLLGLALLLWISNGLWRAYDAIDGGQQVDEVILLHPLLYGALASIAAQLRNRGWPGLGVISAWLAFAAIIGGVVIQWPLGPLQEELRNPNRDIPDFVVSQSYWAIGAGCVLVVTLTSFLRSGSLISRAGISAGLALAALAVYAMIFLGNVQDPGVFLGLRLIIGSLFYILCIALILIGSRDGFRATGTMGILGFIVQTFYVYWETFEGLLTASAFFFGAGVLLFAISFGLLRWRNRLLPSAKTEGDAK